MTLDKCYVQVLEKKTDLYDFEGLARGGSVYFISPLVYTKRKKKNKIVEREEWHYLNTKEREPF